MVRTLDRKLLRDLRKIRSQAIAIGLIIACGIACWVTVLTAYRGLKGTKEAYYREYRMGDVFATVKKAPRRVLVDLERVPGVRQVVQMCEARDTWLLWDETYRDLTWPAPLPCQAGMQPAVLPSPAVLPRGTEALWWIL